MSRLIDADKLKDYIDMQSGRPFIGCTVGDAMKIMIDEQPTIEERKKGEWIKEDSYINRYDDLVEIMRCSLCGQKHYYVQGVTSLDDDTWFSFCPNCGSYNGGNGDA